MSLNTCVLLGYMSEASAPVLSVVSITEVLLMLLMLSLCQENDMLCVASVC